MNPKEEGKALDEIKSAISVLESQKSLTTGELLKKYYVERESKFVNSLKNTFRFTASQPIKVLFSGHIGSGKSSELFKIKQDLENEFLMVYYSVKEYMNLSGINTSELMETMANQLKETAVKSKVKIGNDILRGLENWRSKGRKIKYRDEKRSGEAGLGGSLGPAKAKGELLSQKGTKTEEIWEQEPDTNELIKSINRLIDLIQNNLNKQVIVIIDDIDKLDLADAEELFLRYSRSLTSPNCKIVYTVPISLLYSHHYRQFESFFHSTYLLPISKVRNKDGSANKDGIDKIIEVVIRRIPAYLFAEGILEKIIMASGGIIRDAIRIIQKCCLICVTEEKPAVDEETANEAIFSVKNEFLRQIRKELYEKLIEVKNSPTKKPDNDLELQRLLYCLGVLEYTNHDTWYDVHPLAYDLAVEKEKEYMMKQKQG